MKTLSYANLCTIQEILQKKLESENKFIEKLEPCNLKEGLKLYTKRIKEALENVEKAMEK